MSEYSYEITDGGLDTLKYRNSVDGSDCDNTEESDSGLIGQLGACCFSDGRCLESIDKARCEAFDGTFHANQKCMDIQCPPPSPSPIIGLSVRVY